MVEKYGGEILMNRFSIVVFLALIVMLASVARSEFQTSPGSQTENRTKVGDAEIHFLLYVPNRYADSDQKLPLMLFLHGLGESGAGNLGLVKRHGPPKLLDDKPDFPFIVVSPQCPRPERGHVREAWNLAHLNALLDQIIAELRVDQKRVYVTGLSMGGYGTWRLAAANPERFAAAIPICGGGFPNTAGELKTLPIWCFHGGKDRVVPLSQSQEMVNAVRASGGTVQLTVYPDAGHDSWTETYANPLIYDWLLGHQRK